MSEDPFLAAGLESSVARWDALGLPRPVLVVVAGSGLGIDLGVPLAEARPLAELLPFAAQAVVGQRLTFELAGNERRPVLYLRGRLHAYQGFSANQVTFPVRLAGLLGAHTLVATNAAGAISGAIHAGDLVLVRDHINLTGRNPLVGSPPPPWGAQFPDMGQAYDAALRRRVHELAGEADVELSDGVYLGLLGPSYETPAEVAAFARLGADLVGMSTVLEVIAARHMGLRCCVLSLATNAAAGTAPEEVLDHHEVLDVGRASAPRVRELLRRMVADPSFLERPAKESQ